MKDSIVKGITFTIFIIASLTALGVYVISIILALKTKGLLAAILTGVVVGMAQLYWLGTAFAKAKYSGWAVSELATQYLMLFGLCAILFCILQILVNSMDKNP